MAVLRTIEIDGVPVSFRASAAVPRLYRNKYQRDIFDDMQTLIDAMSVSSEGESTLSTFNLELFENIAHIMAKHADPSTPDDVVEWLDQFSTFSIYYILPAIIELWGLNVETEAEAKKKVKQPTGK